MEAAGQNINVESPDKPPVASVIRSPETKDNEPQIVVFYRGGRRTSPTLSCQIIDFLRKQDDPYSDCLLSAITATDLKGKPISDYPNLLNILDKLQNAGLAVLTSPGKGIPRTRKNTAVRLTEGCLTAVGQEENLPYALEARRDEKGQIVIISHQHIFTLGGRKGDKLDLKRKEGGLYHNGEILAYLACRISQEAMAAGLDPNDIDQDVLDDLLASIQLSTKDIAKGLQVTGLHIKDPNYLGSALGNLENNEYIKKEIRNIKGIKGTVSGIHYYSLSPLGWKRARKELKKEIAQMLLKLENPAGV